MQLCVVMMVVCGKGFIHGTEPHDKHISVCPRLWLYQEAPLDLRPLDTVSPPIILNTMMAYITEHQTLQVKTVA